MISRLLDPLFRYAEKRGKKSIILEKYQDNTKVKKSPKRKYLLKKIFETISRVDYGTGPGTAITITFNVITFATICCVFYKAFTFGHVEKIIIYDKFAFSNHVKSYKPYLFSLNIFFLIHTIGIDYSASNSLDMSKP